jgi:hypothetical protein
VPTVIDSLIVKLGLDPSNYKKGQKDTDESLKRARESSEKTRKGWEADAKKAAAAFRSFRNEIIAIGTAYLGLSAIKSFTANIVTSGAAVGYLAKNVGVSVETLSSWEGAANKMGATAADVDQAFRTMAQQIADIQVGKLPADMENLSKAFALAGESGDSLSKFLVDKDPAERLLKLADVAQKLGPVLAQGLLGGTAGAGFITMAEQGRAALEARVAEQKKLFAFNDAEAKHQQEMLILWNKFIDRIRTAGLAIVTQLEGPLLRLMTEFQTWLLSGGGFQKIVQGAKDFAGWLDRVDWKKVESALEGISRIVEYIVGMLGNVKEIGGELAGASIGSRLGAPLGIFGRIGGALLGGLVGREAIDFKKQVAESDWYKDFAKRHKNFAGSPFQQLIEGVPLAAASANPPIPPAVGAHSAQPAAAAAGAGTVNNFNAPIIVNTQATDAAGVARGLKTEITKQFSTTTQANGGSR